MPAGPAPGAFVLPPGSPLPPALPPGLVVVQTTDPDATVAGVLAATGAADALPAGEAARQLRRRRAGELAAPRTLVAERRDAAGAARAALQSRPAGLATVPPGLLAAQVRSAARNTLEAVENLRVAREAVGDRPSYDQDAARLAREAQSDVERARQDRASALPRANWVLTRANAFAAVLVVGRLWHEAFDRTFVFVIAVPLVALAYAVHVVLEPVRRGRAAGRRRWSALRSMNVSTMAGLAALEERTGAWQRRAARVKTAEAEVREERDIWRRLVGESVALASADRLAIDLDKAEALEAAAGTGDRAWAEAALALQAAEDTIGRGGAPVVVLDPDVEVEPEARQRAMERLAALAGAATVVMVVAVPEPAVEAAPVAEEPAAEEEPVLALLPPPATRRPALAPVPAPPGPLPGPSRVPVEAGVPAAHGSGIVDLRERVRAGLQKLRARSTPQRDRRTAEG